MISLAPLKNADEIKVFFEKSGCEYNVFSGCVTAKDNAKLLGFCLYDLNDKMIIKHIEPMEDLALADGILRSTLHVAAEKSIMKVFYADTVPEDFFKKLNFIKDQNEKSLNIDKLFQSCQSCSK